MENNEIQVPDFVNDKIQVPDFVNERYYEKKYRESQEELNKSKQIIKNLSIKAGMFKAMLILSAGLAVVEIPAVSQKIHDVTYTFIENDNKKLDEEYQRQRQEVIDMTGKSPEEIIENGKAIH